MSVDVYGDYKQLYHTSQYTVEKSVFFFDDVEKNEKRETFADAVHGYSGCAAMKNNAICGEFINKLL